MIAFISRRESFSSSHRVALPNLSDKENMKLFGACSNKNGHGHNYILEITIKGKVNPKTGYVIDLKEVKEIMHQNFLKYVDHKNLNLDVDFLKGINPTTENIAIACWNKLNPHFKKSAKLFSIKIFETDKNFVEYRGE
ncbi:MAG: 6-carboxytetrahydropterin synthase [Bacteroidota bacterium]